MPASSVVAGGIRTRRPGSYSTIDGSGLSTIGPGIKKLVIIGEAEGGKPGAVLTGGLPTFLSAAGPQKVMDLFRGGNCRKAGLVAFKSSNDPQLPNGPQQVLFYKVNPATQAAATLDNADGDALTVTTRDYGAFCNQVNINLAPGTTKGRSIAIAREDVLEGGDDIGGDDLFTARYDSTGELDAVTLTVDATGTRIAFTDQLAASVVAAAHDAGEKAIVVSANAYDTVQKVTVYGVDSSDEPVSEVLALTGADAVTGAQAFKAITGVRINGATRGAVTVSDESTHSAFVVAATLTASHISGEKAEVVSADNADKGQVVTVYGYSVGGIYQTDTVVLNGTTAAAGAKAFGKITAAQLSGVCAGTVTVRSDASNAVAFTIAAGSLSAGMNVGKGVFVPNKVAVDGVLEFKHAAAPGASPYVVVRGKSKAGVVTAERLVLSDSYASTTTEWASLTHIEIGMGEAANAIDWKGNAIDCPRSSHPYVQQVVDAIDGKLGFHATALVDGAQAYAQANLDAAEAGIKGANDIGFGADLDALVAWINANSTLVSAARAAGATGAPSNTPAPVYLIGGSEGVTTAAHWQAAYEALKGKKDVILVPLTNTAAIHAMQVAHNRFMEGKGRDERNGYVGLSTSLDRAGIKSAIRTLNDRNTCTVAQKPTLYDENGVATEYETWMLAVIAAAMQAGAPIAEPLTWKALNALSLSQNTDWTPANDAEEMLEIGLMFGRLDDERGVIWERSITSYRKDDNPIFTEMSANESANESTKRCRRNVETQIGQRGFTGRAAVIQGLVQAELAKQVDEGIIKGFLPQSVQVVDAGDTYEVSYEIAPIEPTNFINITAHLRRLPASAA